MAFDIGGTALEFFLDIIYLIVLYISKIGVMIGLMFTTEKLCKAIIYKNWKFNSGKIVQGLGMISISLVFYLILV